MSDSAAPSASTAPETQTPIARVALVILCGIVVALNVGKIPPSLPSIRDELMLGLIALGVVVSALNAIGALTGGIAGVLVDRWGARRMLCAALLAAAAGNAIGAFAPSGPWLIVDRLLEGLAFILVLSAAPMLLGRLATPRDRGLVMGFWGTFLPVGSAIAILAAPPLLEFAGWRTIWATLATLSLAAFVAFWLREARAAEPMGHTDVRFADLLRVVRAGPVVLLGLAFAAFSFAYIAILAFLPTSLEASHGASVWVGAAAALGLSLANAIGNITGGWLLRRGVPAWKLIAAGALSLIATALLIFLPGPLFTVRAVIGIALGVLGGWIPTSAFATAARLAPEPRLGGAATGLVVQILNIGSLLGPLTVSAVVDAASENWTAAAPVLVAAGLVSLLCGLAIRRAVEALPPH